MSHFSTGRVLIRDFHFDFPADRIMFPRLMEHHFSTQAALTDEGDQSKESQEEVGARGFLILAVNCEAPTSKKKKEHTERRSKPLMECKNARWQHGFD